MGTVGIGTLPGKLTMKTFIALAILVAAAHAAPLELDLDNEWENFKLNFERNFISSTEHNSRRAIFAENLRLINKHNAEHALGLHTYTLGVNKFADMTNEEFVRQYNGYVAPSDVQEAETEENIDISSLPKSVDWRAKGYVTPVKNQQQCGSCWAFSAVASMEGAHFKKTGKLVSLSEQNLVDCVTVDYGCNGGLPADAISYVILNGGIDTEASYKYTARDGQCHFKKSSIGATFSGLKAIPSGNENALTQTVAEAGPVSVAIDASHYSFQLYDSGVYNEKRCSSYQLDHGVAVVGYGTEDGKDYYLVKNSWGQTWGENGYIKMSRNHNNQCGIATNAVLAIA